MLNRYSVVLLILIAVCTSMNAQTETTVQDLFWLSGCWQGRQGTAVVEEMWSKPAGSTMLGLSRTVRDNRTVSFEFMQFREQDGVLAFLPQPQGGPQVRFPLKENTSTKFTFENLNHDFPQRVIYERKNNLLVASIEGTEKGKSSRQESVMRKVRCN